MSLFRIFRKLQPRHPPGTPDGTPSLEQIGQDDLENYAGLTVILGPAGSGKTVLLKDLAEFAGTEIERAAFFVADPDLAGPAPLFIDGCDEVGLSVEQRPVGEVQKALKKLSYPKATITCRGIDWSHDSDSEQFQRAYGDYPLVLDLLPFTREDALQSMTGGNAGSGPLDKDEAESLLSRLDDQSLSDFYTNPLNLEIIVAIIAGDGMNALPESRSELFAKAGDLLCTEHREAGRSDSPLDKIGADEARDAVGLLCLAAVISGQGVIARARGQGTENVPTIPDLENLASKDSLRAVLQSRLFRPDAAEGLLMPVHKMVGDYLAAQWLIQRADGDPRRVRRIVRSLAPQGLPSADRRALWAWLAADPAFTPLIVDTDPVSVLHYGDPDSLSDDNMVALLRSMAARLTEAPGRFFDDRDQIPKFSIGSGRPNARAWLKKEIFDDDANRVTRIFALDLAKSCPSTLDDIREELLDILRNQDCDVALRTRAASICPKSSPEADWESIVQSLVSEQNSDAADMAGRIIRSPVSETLPNDLRAEVILAVIGAQPGQYDRHPDLIGKAYGMFDHIPTDELAGLLETIKKHPWWELAVGNDQFRRIPEELSHPVKDALQRLSESGMLSYQQLTNWWDVATSSIYDKKSLTSYVADAWSKPEFRQLITLHILRTTPDTYDDEHFDWLDERLRAKELDADDILVVLQREAEGGNVEWSEFNRLTLARFVYDNEHREASQILHAIMIETRGMERWTRHGWREWSARSRETPAWRIRENARIAENRERQHIAQRQIRERLLNPEEKQSACRMLANAYLGWWRYNDISRFENLQSFRDYLGEQSFSIFLAECETCLADKSVFSVGRILEGKPNSIWYDCAMAMFALWNRLETGRDFSNLSDEARAAGWFAAAMKLYGPRRETITMEGERERLQSALQCPPEMINGLRERFAAMSFSEFKDRDFLRDATISKTRGDRLAFETGLAWIRSNPERLPDRFSGLLTDLRNVDLPEAEIDEGLANLAMDLRVSRIDLPEGALRTLEAIRFLHDPELPIPEGAGEGFLFALGTQLNYYFRNTEGGYKDVILKPMHSAKLFNALRAEILRMPDVDHFINREHSTSRMTALLKGLRADVSDVSKAALDTLEIGNDSWNDEVRDTIARQREAWARQQFDPLGPEDIAFMVDNKTPQTADQMHNAGLEALEVLQDRLRSSSVDLATAYAGIIAMKKKEKKETKEEKEKKRENALNAHTVSLLSLPAGVQAFPEHQMRDESRADIGLVANAPNLLLPIEAKGQWHRGLYSAVVEQLEPKYASHWQSGGRGIYLVYWLGAEQHESRNKVCKPTDAPRPKTPEKLKVKIEECLPQEMRDRISVVVLDITGN